MKKGIVASKSRKKLQVKGEVKAVAEENENAKIRLIAFVGEKNETE